MCPYTTIELWDEDFGGYDDRYAITSTNGSGYFQFPAISNYDYDGNNFELDFYIRITTSYNDSDFSSHEVTNFNGDIYEWRSFTIWDLPDGWHSFTQYLSVDNSILPAIWIFQDLRNAWQEVYYSTDPQIDPGATTVKFEINQICYPFIIEPCTSFFYAEGEPFIFITYSDRFSSDVVVHEIGHNYMHTASDWWWWNPLCWNHNMFEDMGFYCGWSEGWADFFSLFVNSDQCFDWGIGPCGWYGDDYYDLELINREYLEPDYTWGDGVEGRVAGSLYDLFDSDNEEYDSATFYFYPIGNIVFDIVPDTSLQDFWMRWMESDQNKHHAIRAIYQNTIDYDWAPGFSPELPDLFYFENDPTDYDAIDLWLHAGDAESMVWELTYEITINPDPYCDITLIDNHWISVAPWPDWIGSCEATIQVSDSIYSNSDTFRVNVIQVFYRNFLPIVNLLSGN